MTRQSHAKRSVTTLPMRLFPVFAAMLLAPMLAHAQTEQSRIVGTIRDVNNAAVPGAIVVVRNERTGEERDTTATGEGFYIITALKPSAYTVTASASNFSPTKANEVMLAVGQELTLDLVLRPTGFSEQVSVVGSSEVLLDTGSARIGANVNGREVGGLPVNGRQLSQLYLQAPGSINTGSGTFGDIRFSGRAVEQNVIRYDGVEGTAIIDSSPGNLNGEIPTPFRLQSSLENIQEFRVDSSNYPAEYGTGTGGQINVVTKSGGNRFHGSAFEYIRNDALDARNFFDREKKSSLRLNQFGGSIGGPVVRDKFFFFFSYEGYRVRTGINSLEAVPSAAACSRAVASIAPFCGAFRAPEATILAGESRNPDFDIAQLNAGSRTDENSFAARLDYRLSERNSMYFRFFRDRGTNDTPEGVSGRRVLVEAVPQNAVFAFQSILTPSLVNEVKIGYNGARTRINGFAPSVGGLDFSAISLSISGNVALSGIAGQGTSSGVSTPGGLVRANSATNGRGQPYTPYSLAFIDSLSWTRGNHNYKFGGEVRAIRLYTDRLGGTTYTFNSLNDFLSNRPARVQYLGDVSAPSPFNGGAAGERLAKQEYYIAYAQDEWKIRPDLTLSYGLRYEYYTPLREERDLQVLFDIETGALRPSGEDAFRSSKTNFGPRVALTWSPNYDGTGFFGGGRTVLRTGFGIYYGPGQTEDQIQPIESDRVSSTISGGSLLAFPANIPAIVQNFNDTPLNRQYQPRAYAADYRIPEKIYQYSVSLQQELPYKMVGTVAYVGSQGRNLFLRSVANRITSVRADGTVIREFDIVRTDGAVQRPFAEVDYKTSGGSDSYNALQLSLGRRFNTGLTLNSQYTFARSFGNTAGSNEARTAANNARSIEEFDYDRGYNNFDVRHSFNLSALYDLPVGRNRKFDLGGIANAIFGNWGVGGIVNARSGLPIEVLVVRPDVVFVDAAGNVFSSAGAGRTAIVNTPGGGASRNVRRPDVIPGVNPYLGDDRQFLNPAAFAIPAPGKFGNLARNALRGPDFKQFDLVVTRRFPLTETVNVEFRTEVFNIFNRTNFANPSATLNNALGTGTNLLQPGQPFTQAAAGSTFGLLRSTVERTVGLGTNRQIQFALRLNF
ncbi:MAG TPA: TonB-dependent receptor [Pyrinomonadaceae bacterium]|nr:TonB-dependent receptor [Pyrinomonadaceae bacterium]